MMKRGNTLETIIIAALLAILCAPVAAQTDTDFGRLLEEIQRNEELLQQATELVQQTSSVKARSSLQTATQLHNESKKLVADGAGSGRLARAAELAKRAREAILQTISIAKREARIADRAQKAIERAALRLDDAKQRVSSNPDAAPARTLVEEAQGQLQRAMHNMREHLYEVSLRLAISSNELSERAIAMLRGDTDSADGLLREIEKTDRVIERVSEQLTPDSPPPAHQLLTEAKDLQLRAKHQIRTDHPRSALDMTERARDLAMRAMRMVANTIDPENVEQALHLTDVLIGEAEEIAAEQNIDALTRSVERARQLQDNARRQFVDHHPDQALRLTLRAREMLKEALARVRKDLDKNQVQAALEQTDAILTRIGEQISAAENDTAKDILQRARNQQARAWDEFNGGQLRPALTHSRLARNLGQRALRQANDESS